MENATFLSKENQVYFCKFVLLFFFSLLFTPLIELVMLFDAEYWIFNVQLFLP
uniref:Uncharacterized protein n=1 Tax=Rhizophora mucronata TaxID=61149 RepID=A0A2P2LL87_RHIMU